MTHLALTVLLLTSGASFGVGVAPGYAPEGQAHDYRLGPGDLLSIHVVGARSFDQTVRISNSGRIRVPYVGIMFVAERTTVQVEAEIADLIRQHELISEPSVRVQVEQYSSRPTYVIGEVNAPGQFVITGELYLLDLISKAGGLNALADETAFLYRRSVLRPSVEARLVPPEDAASSAPSSRAGPAAEALPRQAAAEDATAERVLRVNLKALREGIHPELNVRLQGGDILYVPRVRPENIFVIGDVRVPGGYTLPRQGQITAAQAVIYAGGLMPTASGKNGFLMRHNAAGVREALPVDFAAIIAGRKPDIPVLPNDIIFIPTSAVKTVTQGLLNMLPQLINQILIF